MILDVLKRRDIWAGLMLIGIGTAAMLIARNYPFGTALRMGPGYFPTLLGGILIVFGLITLASGVRDGERIAGSWSLRALIVVPLSLVLFGVLMAHAGFIPALVVLIVGSAAAGSEFRTPGGAAVCDCADRAGGRGVRLRARPALPALDRLLTPSWTFLTISFLALASH